MTNAGARQRSFDALKKAGYKYGKGYELPTLGVLALSEGDVEDIAGTMGKSTIFCRSRKASASLASVQNRD